MGFWSLGPKQLDILGCPLWAARLVYGRRKKGASKHHSSGLMKRKPDPLLTDLSLQLLCQPRLDPAPAPLPTLGPAFLDTGMKLEI